MNTLINQFRKINIKFLSKSILCIVAICFLNACSKDEAALQKFNYRLKEVRDANNKITTSYEYNSNNQVIKGLDGAGVVKIIYLYNSAGYLTKTIYIDSYESSYVLDVNGRILEEIYSINSVTKEKTIYVYDAIGNKIEEKYYKLDNSSSNYIYINSKLFYYNSKNQLVKELTPQYNVLQGMILVPVLEISKEYQYDDRGNRNLETLKTAKVVDGNLIKQQQLEYIFDNIKPDYYPNSTLSKNNPIEKKETIFNNNGAITYQSTLTLNYTYNESGYITKLSNDANGSINYILEKIN